MIKCYQCKFWHSPDFQESMHVIDGECLNSYILGKDTLDEDSAPIPQEGSGLVAYAEGETPRIRTGNGFGCIYGETSD